MIRWQMKAEACLHEVRKRPEIAILVCTHFFVKGLNSEITSENTSCRLQQSPTR